jgi:glycosyltransferase involved in cell wall biosynthesis
MRIAVNAIFLQNNQLEGYGHFADEVLSRLVKDHPEHEFIFLFDRPYDQRFIYASNVIPLLVTPPARHPLAFKWWYDVKAPLALRRYKPDVWLQPYGFCSLTSSIPQVMILHDLAFLHYPDFIPWYHRLYYRFFTPDFLQKANKLVTVSNYTRSDMVSNYQVKEHKISVIPGAARTVFAPLSFGDKEEVKAGYADGREYFLFVGGIHPRKNLMNLLKAFSLFKKWQHSNMKLLVAGRLAWQYQDIVEKLKTYKYRDDVVMLGYLTDEQLAKITASAYALVYPSFFEGFGLPLLEAMQSGIPVIASDTSSMTETGGDAARYAPPNDPDAIAKEMLALYRDENLRSACIYAGLQRAASFSWDTTASEIWEQLRLAATPE